MKVLIVDDDRDVADSLAALVRLVLDYDVCVRYSGETAISTAGKYRPDVVIVDVNMPGLDGLQTAQILKTDRRLDVKCQEVVSGCLESGHGCGASDALVRAMPVVVVDPGVELVATLQGVLIDEAIGPLA